MPIVNEHAIEYLKEIPPPFRIIAENLRALIFKLGGGQDVTETFQKGSPAYQIKGKTHFFIEKQPKRHIKFGILAEPKKIYDKNTDANIIEIQSKEDIETLGITELIRGSINNV
ncbi:MAG: DUF1801 domain-containing protein [Promethearchaeia archaeon]